MVKLFSRPLCALLLTVLCSQAFSKKSAPDPEQLQLASVGAAVATLGEETALYQKRADWVMPIASVTKVMTALVVLESGAPLDQWLTVEKRHFPAEANAFSRIRPGSEAKRSDLLQIALISSENYAAYLLARHHPEGYDAFIAAMNAKAQALGMTQTRFVDSTGLSDANVSSANDLLKLVNAAYANDTLRQLSTQGSHYVRFKNPAYT
ncbi:MAG TPA: serine hydrolase, partial [Cellvibrionaceae bacterium]